MGNLFDFDFSLSYLCACKKIKILMSSNQSIILEREACEHVLLVFVSIMSSNNQKEEFKHFMPIIRPFFRKNFESLLASIQVRAGAFPYRNSLLVKSLFASFSGGRKCRVSYDQLP